jgi:predicted metal-dependent enzyme (double-stranded beta helix superfamily)
VFVLDDFVNDILSACRGRDGGAAVAEVLRHAVSRPRELEAALGPIDVAGDTVLFASPELTVSHLVWAPRMAMYPHDHRMWTAIGVYVGVERNLFYRRSDERLVASGAREVHAGEVVLLEEVAIHAVINPTDVFTAALHVFGGDFVNQPRSEWDWESLTERPYDEERTQRVFDAANAGVIRG